MSGEREEMISKPGSAGVGMVQRGKRRRTKRTTTETQRHREIDREEELKRWGSCLMGHRLSICQCCCFPLFLSSLCCISCASVSLWLVSHPYAIARGSRGVSRIRRITIVHRVDMVSGSMPSSIQRSSEALDL